MVDYKPTVHLGLDHDLDHYFLDGTPRYPDAQHPKVPTQAENIAQSLDVIRQDKSKLVEEDYKPKEWVKPKLDLIKTNGTLGTNTIVIPDTVIVRDNAVCMDLQMTQQEIMTSIDTTENTTEEETVNTSLQLLLFQGGIVKIHCLNSVTPSKFSFEIVEKPANLTPYNLNGKVSIESDGLSITMDDQNKLIVKFNPFMMTIVSTKKGCEEPLFKMNSNKSLHFDSNFTADFTFFTDHLYGIPERAHHVGVEDTKDDLPYRFFNLDIFGYAVLSKNGLYGCIPIMISRKKDSPTFVSVFWQNTSETYTDIHKSNSCSDTFWISERGNLECYVFVNHRTEDHFKSLANVTGNCAMPQYFSLGYHQCRYSYNDQQDLLLVNEKFNSHEIPCDSLTLDIDHTDEMRYFTWNYDLFPDPKDMQDILHHDGRKLITIADPHIKADKNYSVYKGAASKGLYIKDSDNKPFVGECWPGDSIYLDYLNEEARDLWASCYSYEHYKDSTPNLWAWNDMNEPSVFESKDKTVPKEALHTVKNLADPENAFQVEHREVHNIYGFCMSKATYLGLLRRNENQNIRPNALSRSFYAGSQKYCAIWTGDTLSTWEHLKISLPMLLSMSLCGISFIGSDVGGFMGDPEPELMVRWYQLGTFMPFFRGHSDKRCKRREPWLYPKQALELVKESIKERYRMLAYWYTTFEEHCRNAMPIMRPVWLEQEGVTDDEIMQDEERFMLGDSLLVVPVLEPGKPVLKDVLKGMQGRWYDYYTNKEIFQDEEINVGIERIGCFLKGGRAIPIFDIKSKVKSSKDAKESNIHIHIGVDESQSAKGKIYFDDGETFDYKKGAYMRKSITMKENVISWEDMEQSGYTPKNKVTKIILMGVDKKYSQAYLQQGNGEKQDVKISKQKDHIVLEFLAQASNNWKIVLKE